MNARHRADEGNAFARSCVNQDDKMGPFGSRCLAACVRDIGLTAFFTSGMIEVILEAKWAAKTLVQQARERASETNNERSKEQ